MLQELARLEPELEEKLFQNTLTDFSTFFSAVFLYIWPLARPNIAEKAAALVEKAKLSSRDQVGCQRRRLDHGLKV